MTAKASDGAMSRGEVEELLPWYAAGTLDASQRRQVEAALDGDPALRRSLAIVREEMDETVLDAEGLGTPSPQALTRLMARVAAEPRRVGWGARLRGAFASFGGGRDGSPWRGLAAAAAMLALAFAAGVVATKGLQDEARPYATASAPSSPLAEGRFAIVGFQPGATAEAIAAVLEKHGMRIVDGPQPGGLFRVRIGGRDMSAAERDRRLATLKSEVAVIRIVAPGGD